MLSLNSKIPMPGFYVNVIAGDGIREDLGGTEIPSLEDARTLMSDAILLGRDISSRRLEICNEAGDVLLTQLSRLLELLHPQRQAKHLFIFPLRNAVAATGDVEKLLPAENSEVSAR